MSTEEKPVSVGEWITTYLILIVPIVNFVMPFVWAFRSDTNPKRPIGLKPL